MTVTLVLLSGILLAAGICCLVVAFARATPRLEAALDRIGGDGWIRGYDYEVRLIPSWYAVTNTGKPGLMYFTFPIDGADIQLETLGGVTPVTIANLLRLGARPTVLDGAPGLLVARSGLPAGMLEQWFIVRGPVVHVVTLYRSPAWPQDSPYLRGAFTSILRTWQWMSYA